MRLLGNRILVRPVRKAQTAGGIHLPADAKYQPDDVVFDVLLVGSKVKVELKPGDRVVVRNYHGQDFTFDNGDIIINAEAAELSWTPPSSVTLP